MNVRCKVQVTHEKGEQSYVTKTFNATIDLTVTDAKRGDAVSGSIEKALKAANEAVLGIASRY